MILIAQITLVHSPFILCLLILTTSLYVVLLLRFLARPLPSILKRVLRTLLAIEIVFMICHVRSYYVPPDLRGLLSSGEEANPSTIFSAMQLAATCIAAFYGSVLRQTNKRTRLFWILLGVLFLFLSLDEAYLGHETLSNLMHEAELVLWGWGWVLVYTVVGLAFVSVVLWMSGRFFQEDRVFIVRLLVGLAIFAAAGIGLEVVYWLHQYNPLCRPGLLGNSCSQLAIFEEFYEMAGVTIILIGLLAHFHAQTSEARWKALLRVTVGGSVIWGIVLALQFWISP